MQYQNICNRHEYEISRQFVPSPPCHIRVQFCKIRHLNMWPILLTENVLFLLLLGKMLCPSKHWAI